MMIPQIFGKAPHDDLQKVHDYDWDSRTPVATRNQDTIVELG